jgi:hypothetical protein
MQQRKLNNVDNSQQARVAEAAGFATWREEIQEAREFVLECARKYGIEDAKEGKVIPPVEFCEDTKSSKMLREAWLEGWHSANASLKNHKQVG